jgi:hypothetical protein
VRVVDDRDCSDPERHERTRNCSRLLRRRSVQPRHPEVAFRDHTELHEEVAREVPRPSPAASSEREKNARILLFGDDPASIVLPVPTSPVTIVNPSRRNPAVMWSSAACARLSKT